MFKLIERTGGTTGIAECCICKNRYSVMDIYSAAKNRVGDQCKPCKTLPNNIPTQALLHQIYNYDPDTGKLTYKRDFSARHKGEDATTSQNMGYRGIHLNKTYLAHRIIWLMQTGELPEEIDHVDHDRTNNRWNNLRDVSRKDNAKNHGINRNNKSGYLGVSFMPKLGKFRASMTVNYKHIHLGLFETAEAANAARLAASKEHQFHSNHGS